MVDYWIQRHDYETAEEGGSVSSRQAVELFQGFDWPVEFAAYDEANDARNCPPGIGLDDGYAEGRPDGRLLHICPNDGDTVFFNFHYSRERKLWGLFPSLSKEIHYVNSLPVARVPELIEWFFEGMNEMILELGSTSGDGR